MEYRIDTPKNVNFIIKLLEQEGHEAFAVGGCVRDALMGREPYDWDITTSAAPTDIKGIFHRTIDTGLQHGTVTVMLDHIGYEVTTYRIDGSYSDGRHPDKVQFTKNLVEDLKRRDFTINAMAYNPKTGIVDEFDGIGDLDRKLIKCVGNPKERFTEDALRMLRAVRFAAKLGFDIEEKTADAIKDMAGNISKVSKERIQTELDKLITSDNPQVLMEVHNLLLDKFILEDSVLLDEGAEAKYEHIIEVMKNTKPDHFIRWAAFMMYEGSNTRHVLKKLKFDNKTMNICGKLVENKGYFDKYQYAEADWYTKKYLIRKLLVTIGADVFEEFYIPFMEAIVGKASLVEIKEFFSEIMSNEDCISKNQMALKGNDLKELGVEPGKVMGDVIDRLFEEILKNPSLNTKEELVKLI